MDLKLFTVTGTPISTHFKLHYKRFLLQKVSTFVRMQHNKYEIHPVCISMSMCYKKYALNKSSRKHYNYCDLQPVLQHAHVSTSTYYKRACTTRSMHFK